MKKRTNMQKFGAWCAGPKPKKCPYTIEVFYTRKGQWNWRVRHGNGNTLLSSTKQGYARRPTMLTVIKRFNVWAQLPVKELNSG